MKIRLLPSAERDIEEIYDYLFVESPAYAEEFLNKGHFYKLILGLKSR